MRWWLAFILISACCFGAHAKDQQTLATNSVVVGKHGTLQITAPEDWSFAQTNAPASKGALLAELHSPSNQIALQLTIYWDGFGTNMSHPSEADFERIITKVAEVQYVPVSVEKKIVMEKLGGSQVTGRFARFTDARWIPMRKGEFSHVTTGMFRCGNLWGNFDLLTNDKNGPLFKQGVNVMESLQRKP